MSGTAWRTNEEIWIDQKLKNGKISITDLVIDREMQELYDEGGRRGPVSVVGSKHTRFEFPGQIGIATLSYLFDKELKPKFCVDVGPLIKKYQNHYFFRAFGDIAEISRMIAHKLSIFEFLKIEPFDEISSKEDLDSLKNYIRDKGGIVIYSPVDIKKLGEVKQHSKSKQFHIYDINSEIEIIIAKSLIMDTIH